MITGSKGGGGKTPVACSVALALYSEGVPILACDFNFNNHDLFTIFQGMNISERRSKGWTDDYVIGLDPYWKINNSFWLTRWHSSTDLGLPSTENMWKKIEEISKLEFPAGTQPKVMVIDTNLTLPLICPNLASIQDYDLPTIEVWHLWSPAIVLQIDEQERFNKAIDILNRFNNGFEENMTHIFTPRHYHDNSLFGTFASIARGEFSVGRKVKLKQQTPKPMLYSEMKSRLFANFLPEILNYRTDQDLNIKELINQWFDGIIAQLEEREYLTSNVLIVPTVVHNIALLVEKLSLKPRRTIDIVIEDLGSLYEIVLDHLNNHRNVLISEFGHYER